MSAIALINADIFLGGLELSCKSGELALNLSSEAKPVTTFCSAGWIELLGGLKKATADVKGLADFAITELDSALTPVINTVQPISLCPLGSNVGDLSYATYGTILRYTPLKGAVGDPAEFELGLTSKRAVARGSVLHDKTTRTGNGNATPIQIGAVSATQSLLVGLHVLSASGTLTAKVQSDNAVGFSSPVDQLTFTAATTVGSQWGTISGPVTDDWWRVNFAVTGSFVFVVTAGLASLN